MSALTDLQNLFRDLFQLELADLDFGIYRLLRLKREEIEAFVSKQLPNHVEKAFQSYASEERAALETEIGTLAERVRKEISEDALLPNGDINPQYQDIKVKAAQELLQRYQVARQKLKSVQASEAQMAEVFNHLYSFFARYYDSGDFIPRRRYGAIETYAVPYRGEEVFFHWANKDQHYVKTAENFRDYAFTVETLSGPSRVRFVLTEASVSPGNLKGDTRYFFPLPEAATWDTNSRTFRLPFHYRLPTEKEVDRYGKNSKFQESLLQEVLPKILKRVPDANVHAVLSAPVDQTNGQDISLLQKRLRHFCRRNTTDYFIHKDLEGFLKRELEFYIKDQVLHLGDLDGDLGSKRRTLRVVRELAEEVITFLAQIENVQKHLFEKRKFVLGTDYLVPIKEVAHELWKEVLSNKEQIEAWKDLFAIRPSTKGGKASEEFLKDHPTLVVNTAYFPTEFKDRLLASFSDLDEVTDGLLIHAENYQALRLLERKYAGKIKCIYIDPPYNTGNDEFIYKDRYRHSSWLAMIEERLRLGQNCLSQDGTITISVDDVEISPLIYLARTVFGDQQQLATLVWDRNRKNDATFFSVGHEYMLVFARDKGLLKSKGVQLRELKPGIEDARKKFEQLRKKYKDDWSVVQTDWNQYVKGLKDYETKGILSKYPKIGSRGPYRDDGNINWPGTGGPRYIVHHPKTKKPCKIPKSGWRYPTEERFWEEYDKGNIAFGPDETTVPGVIYYLFESTDQVMGTVFWSYAQTALDEFNDLFGRRVFENPKNWRDIKRVCNYLTARDDWICDYFAGSGTTGHAVIELNRESQSRRRFLLIEMADYFDTVILPRIQKVMYASAWKDGKPTGTPANREINGTPKLIKIIRLEGYDDTLHNLATEKSLNGEQSRAQAHRKLLGEDAYRLHYLVRLPLESSSAMLDVEALEHPFEYKIEVLTEDGPRVEPVDLVETFNLLYGLHVYRLETWINGKDKRVYRAVKGKKNNGESILILWRDMIDLDPVVERDFLDAKLKSEALFGEVLINGDSATPGVKSLDGIFKRLLEEEER